MITRLDCLLYCVDGDSHEDNTQGGVGDDIDKTRNCYPQCTDILCTWDHFYVISHKNSAITSHFRAAYGDITTDLTLVQYQDSDHQEQMTTLFSEGGGGVWCWEIGAILANRKGDYEGGGIVN